MASSSTTIDHGHEKLARGNDFQNVLMFLQKLVVDKDIGFNYCETSKQLADIFTKPLDEAKFTYFRDRIMYCPREVADHIDEVQGGKAEH